MIDTTIEESLLDAFPHAQDSHQATAVDPKP